MLSICVNPTMQNMQRLASSAYQADVVTKTLLPGTATSDVVVELSEGFRHAYADTHLSCKIYDRQLIKYDIIPVLAISPFHEYA